MRYKRAEEILPKELIERIQQYVDGESIYIPRRENTRRAWGHSTSVRAELAERNAQIRRDRQSGMSTRVLAEKYFLSEKSIQRILRDASHAEVTPKS